MTNSSSGHLEDADGSVGRRRRQVHLVLAGAGMLYEAQIDLQGKYMIALMKTQTFLSYIFIGQRDTSN